MRAGPAAVVFLAALATGVLLPNFPSGRVPAEDAGVFFYAAQRLLDGGAPYRDVWDHKPPGAYFVDALGLALGGVVGVWIVQVAFVVAAALLGYRALRAAFGEAPALLGSVAWIVALPRLALEDGVQTSFVELFGLPLQFGALLLYGRGSPSAGRALAIGVLGGLAMVFKPTLVGIWIAITLVIALSHRSRAAGPIAAMALGVLAPLALVALWAIARGAFGEMVDQVLTYNSAYSRFAPLGERVEAIASGFRLTLPSGAAPVAAGAAVYAVASRRWAPPLLALGLIALPLEIALGATGRGYHYYFIAWLPAIAVMVAFAASEVVRRLSWRSARVALLAIALLMSIQPALLVTRLARIGDDGRFRAAAAYVAANTRPSDTVLVWGSHTEVLFLARRLSPTRYVYQYAALSTRGYATSSRVAELLFELERRR
ncbi:MAG TPA: hypothetical protein VGQ86_07150, partial [Candidatus Limnocylindria bacterium]|nr:hypothetical protein [Candidatus Limnocylindria bacterium]